MKKKHQQYSKVENVTKTLTSIGLTKKYWKTTKMKLNQGYKKEHTGRNGSYWGETKTNSSTTVSEKAGERKKRGRKRKRRCYQELEVTFKNER